MKKFFKTIILSLASIFAIIVIAGNYVHAANPMRINSDFPVNASSENGSFVANVKLQEDATFNLQGWVAVDNLCVRDFYWQYTYDGKTYKGGLLCDSRDDVYAHFAKQKIYYKTCAGYRLNNDNEKAIPKIKDLPKGTIVSLKIYANIGMKTTLIGTYNIEILNKNLLSVAKDEFNIWNTLDATKQKEKIKEYFRNAGGGSGAWCAAFVSYCAQKSGYTQIKSSRCSTIRDYFIKNNKYVSNYRDRNQVYNKVKPGDIVFFIGGKKEYKKNNNGTGENFVTHHIGIVNRIYKDAAGNIFINYYHGNANNGGIANQDFWIDYAYEDTAAVGQKAILGFGLMH